MKKKTYYKIETIRILLYPILLLLLTAFFVSQGWVKPEYSEIVWVIIVIQTLASLFAIGLVYFLKEGKKT
jgi:hypothetical protein